ncbi:MAG TPA: hypothetical protein VHZ07_15685 [Bryobacteraceae bacterium]|jgi:hypothetical protein|nr:hypothetical protein [Bryobacteraceae bacterium]
MKRVLQVGLVVEGNSTRSAILRLPKLADEIGPIKSGLLRVAKRVSNFLHAGYAVSKYSELQSARVILIRVPDSIVPRIVHEICDSELQLKDMVFVLCETWLSSDDLRCLESRGAQVASLVDVPGGRRNWYIVEGHPNATRHLRRVLEISDARALELRRGTKPLYFAACLFANVLALPLFLSAEQELRAAGITGNNMYTVLDDMGRGMLRDFANGARTPWGGPLADCPPEAAAAYMAALREKDPELTNLLEDQLSLSRRLLSHSKKPVEDATSERIAARVLPNS